MDFNIPGLIDLRDAGRTTCFDVASPPREIFGAGTQARRSCGANPDAFDLSRIEPDRTAREITSIVLHSTAGTVFDHDDIGTSVGERMPRIIAHFLVLNDGSLVYTHDAGFTLNDAGGRRGIDIEFTGHFSSSRTPHEGAVPRRPQGQPPDHVRLSVAAIRAGRRLIAGLSTALPQLGFIHPHGQVQAPRPLRDREGNEVVRDGRTVMVQPKRDSCPGPDVWVNVGEWAVRVLDLRTDTADGYYSGGVISRRQSNDAYDQQVPDEAT